MDAIEVNAILAKYNLNRDESFRYMMLGRLESDCEYYLGNGRIYGQRLWVDDAAEHIEIMRALWQSLPVKPEWLTMEQIDDYAKQMGA